MSTTKVPIKQDEIEKAYQIIKQGGLVVCPTRVGYILAGTSAQAMEKKFKLKHRPLRKSSVVLTDYAQLEQVALIPQRHRAFIDGIEKIAILCGFILERKEDAFAHLDEKSREMSKQPDGTSCFVIHHGCYSEYLVSQAKKDGIFILASSANKSGTGNRGRFENIGEEILGGVDYAVEHNEYVSQDYAPDSGEQGVMVSLLTDRPVVIRQGLKLSLITDLLTQCYGTDGWDMKHGLHP